MTAFEKIKMSAPNIPSIDSSPICDNASLTCASEKQMMRRFLKTRFPTRMTFRPETLVSTLPAVPCAASFESAALILNFANPEISTHVADAPVSSKKRPLAPFMNIKTMICRDRKSLNLTLILSIQYFLTSFLVVNGLFVFGKGIPRITISTFDFQFAVADFDRGNRLDDSDCYHVIFFGGNARFTRFALNGRLTHILAAGV